MSTGQSKKVELTEREHVKLSWAQIKGMRIPFPSFAIGRMPERGGAMHVRREVYLRTSPKAARRVPCDRYGRAAWVAESRLKRRAEVGNG